MGSLENLNYISFLFYYKKNKDLHLVSQADIVEPFKKVKGNLEKYALASLASEMIVRSQIEEHPNTGLFTLLLKFLFELNEVEDQAELSFFWFQLNFLINNGFKPKTDTCLNCEKPFALDDHYYFSFIRGGYTCRSCDSNDTSTVEISGQSLQFLNNLIDFNNIKTLREPVPAQIIKETSLILYRLIQYHVSGLERLSSMEFLRNVWS